MFNHLLISHITTYQLNIYHNAHEYLLYVGHVTAKPYRVCIHYPIRHCDNMGHIRISIVPSGHFEVVGETRTW